MSNKKQPTLNLEKKLPEFRVKISEDYDGWLLVTCPREDCEKMFLVERKPWTKTMHSRVRPDVVLYGRPCPYCVRVARIPKISKRTKASDR